MIPRTIVARPEDDAFRPRPDPDVLPLPGVRRAEREPAANPPALPAEEFSPRDILNALRFHSVLFVTLGSVAAAGLAAAGWLLVPAKYTTYALIQVAQADPKILPSPTDAARRDEFATFIKTQAAKIKSTGTMIGALRDPKNGIAQLPMLRREEAPESFLEEKIVTEFSETNELLKVMLSGEDPAQVAKIVNAVVDYYMLAEETERQWKTRRIEQLKKIKEDAKQALAGKERHFKDNYGTPAGNETAQTKQRQRLEQYWKFKQTKENVQFQLAAARDKLKSAQDRLAGVDSAPLQLPDLSLQIDNHAGVAERVKAIAKLDKSIADHLRFSSVKYDAHYASLNGSLKAAQADLSSFRKQVQDGLTAQYRAGQRLKFAAEVEAAQDEIQKLTALDQLTAKELEKYQDVEKEVEDKKGGERRLSQAEIDHHLFMIERYDMNILGLTAELDAPQRVRVWQKAEPPQKSEIKKQVAVSGLGGFLGLGLVGGCLTVYELRRKRVYGPKDPVFRRLPLVGCLPDYEAPPASAARPVGTDPAGRAFFEAVDKVKAVICRQMQRRRVQTLLVTSAGPGEGKSALAWHLALSLARTDKRTLFIDGNLRNPGLHNHFDIASHPGLSELLRGEKAMPEVVQRTSLDNLWCLAAGVCDESSRQALDKGVLRRLLERARQDYDYVVIDSCSIREAVDPLYLAQRADATVLSVRTFHSCTTDVERARERLTVLGTQLLGAVLTDASDAGSEL